MFIKFQFTLINSGWINLVKNIVFKNISVIDSQSPFSIISGYDADHAIENVTIDKLTIMGKRIKNAQEGRFFIENAKGIVFK